MAETKCLQMYNLGATVPSVISPQFAIGSNIIPLGLQPGALQLNQGTGQGQRVGNKVSVVSSYFRGVLYPQQQNATTNPLPKPVQIKMWIFYDKDNPTDVPNPEIADDFFQDGNTSTGFSNGLPDLFRPVNTDRWRILASRVFKVGTAVYSGSGPNVAAQYFANNDFKFNCSFSVNLAKCIGRTATFDDNVGDAVQRQAYAMFLPYNADGSAIADDGIPAAVSYMQALNFKDL